jgi:uncharacterized OsmC-like protein
LLPAFPREKCASVSSSMAPPHEMRFTKFLTHAKLRIAAGGDAEKAKKLLDKAEASCLVTNSLSSDNHLTTEVTSG